MENYKRISYSFIILCWIIFLCSPKIIFAQTSVGETSLSVDVSDIGAATCQIPIVVPPGTNGVQPNLSIVYNSHSRMGLLGWGWHLSGLSSVSRVQKNRYFDGTISGIGYNQYDVFALDGQRMLLINPSNQTEYGLENEDFTRIISHTSSGVVNYFEVITSEGTVMEYKAKMGTLNTIYAYYVSKLTDPNGNYMNFYYKSSSEELLIDSITYTGNTGVNPYNSVRFKYRDIGNYENITYIKGVPFKQSKVLEEIIIRSEGEQIRRYVFEYKMDFPTHLYPFLSKITEYGRNGAVLNPVQIAQNTLSMGQDLTKLDTTSQKEESAQNRTFIGGDFDGDKRGDYITVSWTNPVGSCGIILIPHLSTIGFNANNPYSFSLDVFRQGGSPAEQFEGYTVADIDYDGRDEIIMAVRKIVSDVRTDSLAYIYLKWDDCNKTFKYKTIKKGLFPFFEDGSKNGREFKVANIDDNQNLDLIVHQRIRQKIENNPNPGPIVDGGAVYIMQNFCEQKENAEWTNIAIAEIAKETKIDVIDYDGNGLSEVLIIGKNSSSVSTWGNGSFTVDYTQTIPYITLGNDTLIHFGDFNGDGITDMLKGTGSYPNLYSSYEIRLGTGNGFSTNTYTNESTIANAKDVYLMDINNDGKTDIFFKIKLYNSDKYELTPSLSIGFKSQNNKHKVKTIPLEGGDAKFIPDNSPLTFFDYDENGTMDYIFWKPLDATIPRHRNHVISFDDKNCLKVKNITESMGIKHNFTYKPIEFNSRFFLYKNHIRYVIHVVNNYQVQKPSNELIHNKNYVFSNSYYDHERESFLGFLNVTVTDAVLNTKDSISYLLIKKVNQLHKASVLTSLRSPETLTGEHKINISSLSLGNKRYAIYPETSKTKDYVKSSFRFTKSFLYPNGKLKNTYTTFSNLRNITPRCRTENEYYYSTKTLSNRKTIYILDSNIHREGEGNANLMVFSKEVSSYYYDTKGNITRTIINTGSKILQMNFTYNSFGLPTEKTMSGAVAGLRKENYEYDSKGRFMTSKSTHYNYTENWTYDKATGNPLTYSDINNNITYYKYDGWGKLISTSYPTGHKDSLAYTWSSVPAWIGTNAKYTVSRFQNNILVESNSYDVLNREVLHMENGVYTQTNYNAKGLLTSVSMPFNNSNKVWTNYSYDIFNRLTSETGPYTDLFITYSINSDYEPYTETIRDHLRNSTTTSRTYSVYGSLQKVVNAAGELSYAYQTVQRGDTVIKQTKIKLNNVHTTIIEEDMQGNRLLLSDPDAGTITSRYNEFNELIWQKDANGVVSEYEYDLLGRVLQCVMTNSNNEETVITYTYDADNKKGTLSSETITPDNTSITYTYNNLTQLTSETYHADNQSLLFQYGYNTIGQLQNITYPYGFSIEQQYDGYGRLSQINRTDVPMALYKVNGFSLYQQPNSVVVGNTMGTINYFDETGRLIDKTTGKGSFSGNNFTLQDASIQQHIYEYDMAGRMSMRAKDPFPETSYFKKDYFTYDASDRLTEVGGYYLVLLKPLTYRRENLFSINYNQNKITSNSIIGDYYYNSSRPHALTEIELLDSNSISLNDCDLTYTSFNKVKTINEGDYNYEIKYFPNQQRAITILKENGTVTEKKIYTDKTFEQTDDKKYFYIYAYGQPIAVFIQEGNNNIRPYFIYTDHLGSIDKITDGNGNVVDSMSFDPWGNRRNPWYWAMKESNTTHLIDRGFTGHQHLDVFELINMNGRMFDPVVQQFLSPDPYVQMPDNPLNFNRYAYALFNPLYWTDPTGMLINPIFDWEGNYLGTDSKGLRGEAIIMNVADFKPGMSHDEALRKGTLRSELPMMIHPDVLNMIDNQMSLIESFNNRPLASGMTEFSPINVEDITLIGPTVKGLISLASWTGKKIFGTSVTKGGGSWATTSGILRDAVKGKGNYGLGTGTFEEAIQAGRSWVGEGFTISKDASSWISSNGLRQFRPPSFKPKLGIEQANFQWRNINKGAWQSNGHLNIIKP